MFLEPGVQLAHTSRFAEMFAYGSRDLLRRIFLHEVPGLAQEDGATPAKGQWHLLKRSAGSRGYEFVDELGHAALSAMGMASDGVFALAVPICQGDDQR